MSVGRPSLVWEPCHRFIFDSQSSCILVQNLSGWWSTSVMCGDLARFSPLSLPKVRTLLADEEGAVRESRMEIIRTPEEVPLYQLVPVRGPDGEVLETYRGVQRLDNHRVVSVVSDRYGLVGHRDVAMAVHAIGEALDQPEHGLQGPETNARLTRESIKLYAGGRRMEVKLVIGREFRLDSRNIVYPGVRVVNSMDSFCALKMSVFAVRLACVNQLHASVGNVMEFRELHVASGEDLLGQLQRATHQVLERFDETLSIYSEAMNDYLPIAEFVPALTTAGIPRRHVDRMAQYLPEYFGSTLWGNLSRWDAYGIASQVLTHEVRVNPDRERMMERAAARALLLPGGEGVATMP